MKRNRTLPAAARRYLLDAKAQMRATLKSAGLSYADAARIISVNPSTVGRWLDDDTPGFIDLEDAVLLCMHMGISVQQMIPAADWALVSQRTHDQRAVFLTMSDAEIDWLLAVWSGAIKVYR
ncbi:helix-turn-helix domain-containing protein [Aeromonas enteropelogenes]|uniref:helix-turn-helix domain-containing protein n=1 Tax=Aeromonas enteropelogenes TaxID=29489 RepID=UPI0039877D98